MSAQWAVGEAEMRRTSQPKRAMRPLQGSSATIEVAGARRRDSTKISSAFAGGLLESGERSECCPSGTFAEGENEVSESAERENKARVKGFVRPLRLRSAG